MDAPEASKAALPTHQSALLSSVTSQRDHYRHSQSMQTHVHARNPSALKYVWPSSTLSKYRASVRHPSCYSLQHPQNRGFAVPSISSHARFLSPQEDTLHGLTLRALKQPYQNTGRRCIQTEIYLQADLELEKSIFFGEVKIHSIGKF